MTTGAVVQLAAFLLVLFALAWPLSRAIDAVMDGRFALGRKLEWPLWRAAGVNAAQETGWVRYALGLLLFNSLGLLFLYALQRLQHAAAR
jgi:K+-transporting ATPase ATPase A chain